MRYVLQISYKGTRYAGWQSQKNAHSIQTKIEKSLEILLKTPVKILGAGRTDTGVHALEQYAQFDTEEKLDKKFLHKLNGVLPNDITVHHIFTASDDFSVRFDAVSRKYIYHIHKRKDPFLQDRTYIYFSELNVDEMQKASEILTEHKNFKSFCKTKSESKNFYCKISEATWIKKEFHLEFHITADRFLHGMVRSIVGTMIEIGKGNLSAEDFRKIIEKQDRRASGFSAPPQGLFLAKVTYPKNVLGLMA